MRLLSLGYQHFRTLREDDRAYVDKTAQIARVLDINKYLFLARPQRLRANGAGTPLGS